MEFTTEQYNFLHLFEDTSNEKEIPPSSYNTTAISSKISTEISLNTKKEIYDPDFSNFFRS